LTIDSAFTTFPTLATSRLLLRQARLEDAASIFRFKSNPEVTHRYGQEPHASIEQTRGWIERLISGYAGRDSLSWVVTMKARDRAIGNIALWNFGEGMRCVELGYELHPDFWGSGLAAEACAAVLDFGFTEMDLNRVEACPLAANGPSNHLLEKLGFTLEGNLRQRVTFRGDFIDQLYYGMLRSEWRIPA
jgi:ribosomal-protein-alanine N-acetyltransferase